MSSQLPSRLVADSASTASGWNTLLQGTIFETGLGGADIRVGVGDAARADAAIIMEGIKTTITQNVNWQPVQLAYNQWSYDQQGLTPAGAALVGVVVAVATGGAGSSLLGTTSTAGSAMADAALSSLAAQASITLINNGGDIGKTLKALGSSDTIKAAVAAALTAGALEKIGTLDSIKPLKGSQAINDKLTLNLINAGGRALTNTAINGGSLEGSLKDALIGGLVDTAHGQAASQIKGLEADYLAHKLAHALAGCAAGTAAGRKCRDGAIGAVAGKIVAELMPPIYARDAFALATERTHFYLSSMIAAPWESPKSPQTCWPATWEPCHEAQQATPGAHP